MAYCVYDGQFKQKCDFVVVSGVVGWCDGAG